jgi:nucleotide-binding universal stress UspA family protein
LAEIFYGIDFQFFNVIIQSMQHDFKTVIVPIMGDKRDEYALALACSIFRSTDTVRQIIGLRVIEIDRSLPVDADLTGEIVKASSMLADIKEANAEMFKKYACDFTPDVKQAREAGPAIVDDAREFNADLIVLTLKTKQEFGEYSLGDVAPYVMENAPCRVILDQQLDNSEE